MKSVFCTECGAALDAHGVCQNPGCATHKQKDAPSDNPQRRPTAAFGKTAGFTEKGKNIVPDCIQPDLDEKPIKQYDIARLQSLIKGARAEGRLQVTNKRLLFRSAGFSIVGPTSLEYEFSIEEIAGIEIRKEARFNFFPTILLILLSAFVFNAIHPFFAPVYNNQFVGTVFIALLAAAAAFVFFFFAKKPFLRYILSSVVFTGIPTTSTLKLVALNTSNSIQDLAFILILIAFVVSLLHLSFAPNLVFRILTKGGSPSVEIRKKDGLFSFQHNEYTGFSQVMPGPDTDAAIREIGALIREVQQTGTYSGVNE